MTRKLCQQIAAQRERDLKASQDADARSYKTTMLPEDKRLTVQAAQNCHQSYLNLLRSIEECRALIRGEDIEVRLLNRPFDRWGKQYTHLRTVCLRASLNNLEYHYATAKQRLIVDYLDRDIQGIRLAIAEITDPDYAP